MGHGGPSCLRSVSVGPILGAVTVYPSLMPSSWQLVGGEMCWQVFWLAELDTCRLLTLERNGIYDRWLDVWGVVGTQQRDCPRISLGSLLIRRCVWGTGGTNTGQRYEILWRGGENVWLWCCIFPLFCIYLQLNTSPRNTLKLISLCRALYFGSCPLVRSWLCCLPGYSTAA